MINSVYDALDAYKRQGRINVPAALHSMMDYDLSKETAARRTALTPETEFLIDCFALANGKLGRLLEEEQRDLVVWSDIFTLLDECRRECQEYWESFHRKIPFVYDLYHQLRNYIAKCVWYYRFRRDEDTPTYEGLLDKYVSTHSVPRYVEVSLRDAPVYRFIPEFIRGITTSTFAEMQNTCEWSYHGFAVGDDYRQFAMRREFLMFGLEAFVCYREGDKMYWASDHFGSAMSTDKPSLAAFLCNPGDPTQWCEDVCYGVMTRRALYFWGTGGVEFDPRQLPLAVLHELMSESSCNGLNSAPAKFYSGIREHGEVYEARLDITKEMYDHFGWHGGSVLSYRIATQGCPRDAFITDAQLAVNDWKELS